MDPASEELDLHTDPYIEIPLNPRGYRWYRHRSFSKHKTSKPTELQYIQTDILAEFQYIQKTGLSA